jgi:hypothetical protein
VSEAKVGEVKRRNFRDRCGAWRLCERHPPIARRHPTDRADRRKPLYPEHRPLSKGPTTPSSSLQRFSGGSAGTSPVQVDVGGPKPPVAAPQEPRKRPSTTTHARLPTRLSRGVLATTWEGCRLRGLRRQGSTFVQSAWRGAFNRLLLWVDASSKDLAPPAQADGEPSGAYRGWRPAGFYRRAQPTRANRGAS